ncbi:MAG: signal peptidase I [Clostridium sp.]|uniref:signal peptidase I n=1 Tax=Clostridium sp. TaxID=1506 RepID=UPI00302D295C
MGHLKRIKEVLYYMLVIFLIFIIIINISSRIPQLYNLTKVSSYTVLTGSMKPVINPGDMVIVKKVSVDKLNVGDIITFTNNNNSITHRITSISLEGITTKGDDNDTEDLGKITGVELTGKVIITIPKIGYAFNIFYNKLNVSIFVVLGGILIVFQIIKSKKVVKENN